jgi:hypothetical protein
MAMDSAGTLVNNDNYSNYSVYIYDLSGVNEVIVTSNTIGNENSIMRYAFYEDTEGGSLVRKGTLNAGGWSDSYEKDIFVGEGEAYLYVVSQNGTSPSVSAKW